MKAIHLQVSVCYYGYVAGMWEDNAGEADGCLAGIPHWTYHALPGGWLYQGQYERSCRANMRETVGMRDWRASIRENAGPVWGVQGRYEGDWGDCRASECVGDCRANVNESAGSRAIMGETVGPNEGNCRQSIKKLFSASLLFSKQNRPPFYSWHNHDFHINTFIHFIQVVTQMYKISGKYMKKHTKLAWKVFFSILLFHFQSQFSIMGLINAILQYNTLSMMGILVTGLKWRPKWGTQNKQRASVKLHWLPSPLTACRPLKCPVSASVQSTNSTKVFDALTAGPIWGQTAGPVLGRLWGQYEGECRANMRGSPGPVWGRVSGQYEGECRASMRESAGPIWGGMQGQYEGECLANMRGNAGPVWGGVSDQYEGECRASMRESAGPIWGGMHGQYEGECRANMRGNAGPVWGRVSGQYEGECRASMRESAGPIWGGMHGQYEGECRANMRGNAGPVWGRVSGQYEGECRASMRESAGPIEGECRASMRETVGPVWGRLQGHYEGDCTASMGDCMATIGRGQGWGGYRANMRGCKW